MEWKQITEAEESLFRQIYEKEQPRGCDHSFVNNLFWSSFFKTQYAIIEDHLVFRFATKEETVGFPLGRGDIMPALEAIFAYFESLQMPVRLGMVNAEQFARLEALYPGAFTIEYDRDVADYIYESEKLISLSGKKLHGKRNHINNFVKTYPDYAYERITDANRDECIQLAMDWQAERIDGDDDDEKQAELQITLRALRELEKYGLVGGAIRADGKIVAFSIGEPLSQDTFVVHIEKAYANIQGAYPIINQQFVAHEAANYRYINREEDTGAENLRKAKLSYYPAFLQEKGFVTRT